MKIENNDDTIRFNIREILKEKQMTIAQVERTIGRRKALSNFLSGTQAAPSVASIQLFAKALNVPIYRIFGEKIEDLELNHKTLAILKKLLDQLSERNDFLKKKYTLSKIAKMVLALQKMTEATQADEVDLAFLEEFLLKL